MWGCAPDVQLFHIMLRIENVNACADVAGYSPHSVVIAFARNKCSRMRANSRTITHESKEFPRIDDAIACRRQNTIARSKNKRIHRQCAELR